MCLRLKDNRWAGRRKYRDAAESVGPTRITLYIDPVRGVDLPIGVVPDGVIYGSFYRPIKSIPPARRHVSWVHIAWMIVWAFIAGYVAGALYAVIHGVPH